MKSALYPLLSSSIPLGHFNVTKFHKKSFHLVSGFSHQFKRVHSLAKNCRAAADREYFPQWFSVAPMMDWTDNHFRTLARLISKHTWLYTEMVVAETIVHQKDNLDRFLAFPPEQHPIVLQIGGSNLKNLAKAAELANAYSYDEINLNCGCPSGKVAGHGCFGARLMFDPEFVGNAMSVIASNCNVPVSVKCRIGVDDRDSYNELCDFVYAVSSKSPTQHFIIHARKALLNGLSPADNRKVPPLRIVTLGSVGTPAVGLNPQGPPLNKQSSREAASFMRYEYYYALMRDFPELQFTLNGGITCISEVNAARMKGAQGVMVGRAAYNNPWNTLGYVDSEIYGAPILGLSRRQVLEKYQLYGDSVLGKYGLNKPSIRQLVKPLLNLFHSESGNGLWKRKADSALRHCKTIKSFLEETLDALPDSVLDSTFTGNPTSPLTTSARDFSEIDTLLPPPFKADQNQFSTSQDDLELSAFFCA